MVHFERIYYICYKISLNTIYLRLEYNILVGKNCWVFWAKLLEFLFLSGEDEVPLDAGMLLNGIACSFLASSICDLQGNKFLVETMVRKSAIPNTGRERLIRSHSSARFCFELSGNSN